MKNSIRMVGGALMVVAALMAASLANGSASASPSERALSPSYPTCLLLKRFTNPAGEVIAKLCQESAHIGPVGYSNLRLFTVGRLDGKSHWMSLRSCDTGTGYITSRAGTCTESSGFFKSATDTVTRFDCSDYQVTAQMKNLSGVMILNETVPLFGAEPPDTDCR